MYAQLDAGFGTFGDAQQLDAVPELFSVADIGSLQPGDAFDMRLVEGTGIPKAIEAMMVSLCAASTPSISKVGSASA